MENNDHEELSKNSKLLLDGGVVDLFIKCKKKFPDNSGLHEYMVGTFEAIVAVKELRSRLMIENFLVSIQELSKSEEFTRIGRSCLQIFVELIRDGQSAWSTKRPTFDEVNRHLDEKLCKWDYNIYTVFGGIMM